ncbi:hypothetical protein NMG60_11016750 [Bertholletia excelsa]
MPMNHYRWMIQLPRPHHGPKLAIAVSVETIFLTQWAAAQAGVPPPPAPARGYPFDEKLKVSPTMAIVLICIISIFFAMGCISVYVRQCVERRMAENFTLESDGVGAGRRHHRRRAVRGLGAAVIAAFPTFVYSEVKQLKIGKAALECAVCLNEFEDDENLRVIPKCSHVFHPDCIDAWLSSHVTCPVCRANLVPKPGETLSISLPFDHTESEVSDPENVHLENPENVNLDTPVNELIVQVQSPDVITVRTPDQNCPPRWEAEKFRRSFSMGDRVVQPGDDCERFTLRLPEEVRNRLLNSGLNRTKSCVALSMERSTRKGYRIGSGRGKNYYYERFGRDGRQDRWGFMMTPPFFSRAGSSRSSTGVGADVFTGAKGSLKSVRSPLHRLFGTAESRKDDVNIGERSFDKLRESCRI